MSWERIPILGNNPVFCSEVRRLWRRGSIVCLVLGALGVTAITLIFGFVADYLADVFPHALPFRGWHTWLYTFVLDPLTPLPSGSSGTVQPVQWQLRLSGLAALFAGLGVLSAQYLFPAIAAASIGAHRRGRRLEPVVASRMTPGAILFGTVAALAAPVWVLALCVAAVQALLVLGCGWGASAEQFWPVEMILFALVSVVVGAGVGLSTRSSAVGVGLSVAIAGIVVPIVARYLGHLAGVWLWPSFAVTEPSLPPTARALAGIVRDGAPRVLIVVLFWLIARRALSRLAG